MRGRIVLFVVLAVVLALVGVYVGWSTNTPTAVGEPAPATPADLSVGPIQHRGSGSGPASPPKASPPNAPPPKASPPNAPPPKACSPTAAAPPAAYATPSGQEPEAEPASQPQESADPVRFGKVTTTPSNDTSKPACPMTAGRSPQRSRTVRSKWAMEGPRTVTRPCRLPRRYRSPTARRARRSGFTCRATPLSKGAPAHS